MVVPLVLGAVVVRRVPTRRGLRVLAALTPLAVATGLLLALLDLPHADTMWIAGAWLVGATTAWLPARRAAQLGTGALLFVAVAIGVGQVALPKLPKTLLPFWPRVRAAALYAPDACSIVWPRWAATNRVAGTVADIVDAAQAPDSAPIVLHLGDSMVAWSGTKDGRIAQWSERFVEQIDARDTEHHHVNAAVAGVGLEILLPAARHWSKQPGIETVVVHLYPTNDLDFLDIPLPCCPTGSMVDWDAPGAPNRCDAPHAANPVAQTFSATPTSLATRALLRTTRLTGHLVRRLKVPRVVRQEPDTQWPPLEATLRGFAALRAEGVDLRVTVLPDTERHGREGTPEGRPPWDRVDAVCAELDLPCLRLDHTWDLTPDEAYAADGVHFVQHAHDVVGRRVQAWLEQVPAPAETQDDRQP